MKRKNSHPAQQHKEGRRSKTQPPKTPRRRKEEEGRVSLCVGDRLGLTLASEDASTDGLADTNA